MPFPNASDPNANPDAANPDGDPADEQPPAQPASTISRDEIVGLVRETVTAAVGESVRALLADRTAHQRSTPQEPAIEDVADEDLDTAVASGAGASAAIRRAARAESERVARQLRREAVDPLATAGMKSLRTLALRAAKGDMPHYERFKDQIDQAVANLPADQAVDPDMIVSVHDFIVGRNWRVLEQEFKTQKAREDDPPKPTQVGSGGRAAGGGPGSARGGAKKRPEDVLPSDALSALSELGRNANGKPTGKSFEEFCRAIGEDPEEYLAQIEAEGNA